MWPSNMLSLGIDVRGRIATAEMADPGRAVARLTGLGLGSQIRALLDPGVPDALADRALVDACVRVLSEWRTQWPQRPSAVVSIGSHTRPVLVDSLAKEIATIGKLAYLGAVIHDGPSSPSRSNSAHRPARVWGGYSMSVEIEAGIGDLPGAAVLVIDDLVDTGWTMTVVARMLLLAGAGRVYPLVLASVR
jgi:ATP-dependent DNA helicase RecQ